MTSSRTSFVPCSSWATSHRVLTCSPREPMARNPSHAKPPASLWMANTNGEGLGQCTHTALSTPCSLPSAVCSLSLTQSAESRRMPRRLCCLLGARLWAAQGPLALMLWAAGSQGLWWYRCCSLSHLQTSKGLRVGSAVAEGIRMEFWVAEAAPMVCGTAGRCCCWRRSACGAAFVLTAQPMAMWHCSDCSELPQACEHAIEHQRPLTLVS